MRRRRAARVEDRVHRNSRPSDLRITDMRTISMTGLRWTARSSGSTRIRASPATARSATGSKSYALVVKSRLVGENPCDIDRLFRKVRQFGFHARQGGGVSAVEMALIDLAGKAYGVPAYQLAGGRYRDNVLCYADTPSERDPDEMVARSSSGASTRATSSSRWTSASTCGRHPRRGQRAARALETADVMHPFTGIQLTTMGIDALVEYVGRHPRRVGYALPLAADHFGHLELESCIRLGRALDPFTPGLVRGHDPRGSSPTSTCGCRSRSRRRSAPARTSTCATGSVDLVERRAVGVVHPDIMTVGRDPRDQAGRRLRR